MIGYFVDRFLYASSMKATPGTFISSPVVTIIPVMGMAIDPDKFWFYVACIVTILMGSVLRIGLLYQSNELTWKAVCVQFLVTLPLCFLAYHVWVYYEWTLPIQIFLFMISLFGVFIAGLLDGVGKIGFRAYLRMMLSKFLADTKSSDKP